MERKNRADSKHIGGFERKSKKRVFGLTFYASPHGAAAFRAVRASPGDIDKCHLWIETGEEFCDCQRQVISYAAIFVLGHSRRGNAQAEEAGIETEKLGFESG